MKNTKTIKEKSSNPSNPDLKDEKTMKKLLLNHKKQSVTSTTTSKHKHHDATKPN